MKLVVGMLITLAALSSQAQANDCNMITLEKQARHFIVAMGAFDTRDIQPCLEQVIQKEMADKKQIRNFVNERLTVLDILAAIKNAKMASIVKCEASGAPGCMTEQELDEESSVLENEADLKRSDVQQQRANGSRDW